jgi:hypothetical protein
LQHLNQHRLTTWFCALMFILAFAFYSAQPLLSDVSYFVESAKRILHGAVPYQDILENNPPLAFWITMPPIWLAEILGFRAETAFVFYTLSIAAGIVTLVWSQTRNSILICAISIVSCFSLAFGFGQREYFAALFLLPYIASTLLGKNQHRYVIGILLGLAVCFKPHFALIPLCVEAYMWRGIWRVELFAAAIFSALFPILIWITYPNYYSDIVPLVLQTYSAYNASFLEILLSSTFVIFAALFILTLIISLSQAQDQTHVRVWLAAGFGAAACHFIQHKGWPYQLLPGISFASIGFLLAVASLKQKILKVIFGLIFIGGASLGITASGATEQQQNALKLEKLLGQNKPNALMILSYDIGDSFPFLQTHNMNWTGHFQSLWMMAAVAKRMLPAAQASDITMRVTNWLLEDLTGSKPDFIIVVQRGQSNLIEPFLSDERFKATWASYELANKEAEFELWRRKF